MRKAPTTLLGTRQGPLVEIAELIQGMLRTVGMDVELVVMDLTTLLARPNAPGGPHIDYDSSTRVCVDPYSQAGRFRFEAVHDPKSRMGKRPYGDGFLMATRTDPSADASKLCAVQRSIERLAVSTDPGSRSWPKGGVHG